MVWTLDGVIFKFLDQFKGNDQVLNLEMEKFFNEIVLL